MELKIFSKPAELAALRECWEGLLARANAANVFLTPEWVSTWCRYYANGAQLQVIGVFTGVELIGLAPLMIEDRRVCGIPLLRHVKFVGTGLSDHLDILLAPGKECEALEAVAAHVFAQSWDIWDLDEIREDSLTAKLLPEIARRLHGSTEALRQSTCPIIKLPTEVSGFRSPQRRDFWKKVDYYRRRLNKQHALDVRFNEGEGDLERDLTAFLSLYRAGFVARPNPLIERRFDEFRRSVVFQMAGQRRLLLALLLVDGCAVSGQLCFRQRRSCYAYNLCHDPAWSRQSVGTVLQWEVLRYLIERGYSEYDFLRGAEAYKFRWGAAPVYQQRIRIWRRKPKLRLLRPALRVWHRRFAGSELGVEPLVEDR